MQAKTVRGLAAGLVVAVTAYALAGFVLGPAVVRSQVATALIRDSGLEVAIGHIRVNPFTLTATLHNVALGDAQVAPSLSIGKAVAQWRPRHLFGRGWRAHNVTLVAPHLIISSAPNRSDSVIGLLSTETAVAVGRVSAVEGLLEFVVDGQPSLRLADVEWAIHSLSTDSNATAEMTLRGVQGDLGVVTASGKLGLSPGRLDVSVMVDKLDVSQQRWSAPPHANLVSSSQQLSAQLQIQIQNRQMSITGDADLSGVTLTDARTGVHLLSAKAVSGRSIKTDGRLSGITADLVQLIGPEAAVRRAADGQLAGLDWLRPLAFGPSGLLAATARVELAQGRLTFEDFSVSPPLHIEFLDMEGSALREVSRTIAAVVIDGRLVPGGAFHIETGWSTESSGSLTAWRYTTDGLSAALLSPYLVAVTGHEAVAGTLALSTRGSVDERGVRSDHVMDAVGLKLVRKIGHKAADRWPLAMATALLEDAQGQIHLQVPVSAQPVQMTEPLTALLLAGIRDHVNGLASRPFGALSEIAQVPAVSLAHVAFPAGSAAITQNASDQLSKLAGALAQRPSLGVEVGGRYGPITDRAALAREQMRLHIALATSAGQPRAAARSALNFDDPRVIEIIQEFAGDRLPTTTLDAVQARFSTPGPGLYQALFQALVDNEPVTQRALNSLARFRARTVVSQLATLNVPQHRLFAGPPGQTIDDHDGPVLTELAIRFDPAALED